MVNKQQGLICVVLNLMANLDKLKPSFSMKDFDINQLSKILIEHQNSLIKLVLIIGSLLAAGWMFNDHRVKNQALRLQTSQAQEKLEVLKTHEAALNDLKNFKSALPNRVNESELITVISDYAKSCHVTITSLSPAESQDKGLYDLISLSFNALPDSFKNMMLFLRKIEKSEFPLRINSWVGNKGDNGQIVFQIEISAVVIHP